MQRPESKPELRRGPEGARGGTGPQRSPRWSPCFLPGSASPTSPHGSPHTPQVPFKTDIRFQPFSRMQNPPVELHSTELNIRVSSVASPHLIPPRSPSPPDVMSYALPLMHSAPPARAPGLFQNTQGLCTRYSSMGCPSRHLRGSFLHFTQVSARMSPYPRDPTTSFV